MERFKIRFVVLYAALVLAVSSLPSSVVVAQLSGLQVHDHSGLAKGGSAIASPVLSGTITGAYTLLSTKACAAGYERLTPNMCKRVAGNSSQTALTRDTCTTIASPDPTNSVAVIFRVRAEAISANLVGALRFDSVTAYNTSACNAGTGELDSVQAFAHEQVAAVGHTLDTIFATFVVKNDGSGNTFLKMVDDSGNAGLGSYRIMGYID